jgi:hypothetical protein
VKGADAVMLETQGKRKERGEERVGGGIVWQV